MRTIKLLSVGWVHHFKLLSRSPFDVGSVAVWPLFFATIAFFMFRAGGNPQLLLPAALGSAVMGIWSSTSVAASSAMQRERWLGTLELLVAAPVSLPVVLLPITIAMSTLGIYSLVATLAWGHFLFGIPITIVHPLLFGVAVVATIGSVGLLGFLLAVTVVRYRTAWALGNVLEYPVWLVAGLLVPLSLLPDWVRPISWALAPTWGMRALRESAVGGSPLPDAALAVLLGAGYAVLGAALAETMLRSARRRATLSLT